MFHLIPLKMLQTICYLSNSRKDLTNQELQSLFFSTKMNNIRLKISGILIHDNGNFFQIIEGKKKHVIDLYQKIENDSRHFNLIKIFDKPIQSSSFKSFRSSYITVRGKKDYSELQRFLKQEKANNRKNFKNISYITNNFLGLIE